MSTDIYDSNLSEINAAKEKKYNYVYLITEISTGMKYIGSRGTNITPIIDLKKYKTSSKNKEFIKNQTLNPNDFIYEILSCHATRYEAIIEESRLHQLYEVKDNPEYYNRSNQKPNGFSTSGKIPIKDKDGNTYMVDRNDPRYLSGELVHHTKGKVTVIDKDGNSYMIDKNEYRSNIEKYKTNSKGKVVVKDGNGIIHYVNCDDPRYLSGELVHHTKGKVTVKDKDGRTYNVDCDDPRYLSGELVGVNKGMIVSDETRIKLSELKKKYYINGNVYIGRDAAAKAIGISKSTLTKRCQSNNPKFKDYYIIGNGD